MTQKVFVAVQLEKSVYDRFEKNRLKELTGLEKLPKSEFLNMLLANWEVKYDK